MRYTNVVEACGPVPGTCGSHGKFDPKQPAVTASGEAPSKLLAVFANVVLDPIMAPLIRKGA
eukprot:6471779-Pyramimonas_sp.AAC.1